MIAYTVTPRAINIVLKGRMRTVDDTHPNFGAVRAALKNYAKYPSPDLEDRIGELVDIPMFIARATEGRVKIGDNEVYFDDKQVHGVIASRLLSALSHGFDVKPLARFLERVRANPIPTAEDELYLWMEGSNLPLTSDGCFLAFKKVNDDYKSYHDRRTDNSIGAKLPELSAERYDTDRYRTCSSGYHFCAYNYLPAYYGSTGRVVICKVAPEDVVSIPNDYNNAKGRAKTYEIIGEVPESEAAQFFDDKPVVTEFGTYKDEDCGDYNEDGAANYCFDWYDNGPDGEDDFGLPENYFAPEKNELVRNIRDKGTENVCTVDAMRAFVNNDAVEEVVNMFTWEIEPQGYRFWFGVAYGTLDDYETIKAKHIVRKYLEIIDQEATADQPTTDGRVFNTTDGRNMTDVEILKIVEAHGQRGASRLLNVPRTTLQDWLTKLGARS